jgi:hypothetical protein
MISILRALVHISIALIFLWLSPGTLALPTLADQEQEKAS